MRRGSQVPEKYEDISMHYDVPNEMVTYNTRVYTGEWWVSINRIFYIETGLLVPHRQHQNYAKGEGDRCNLKLKLPKLFCSTPYNILVYL